jgi:hypothetical protein
VAIRTIFSYVGEYRLGMAAGAGHLLMHPAQRIPRGVVIELWDGPDGSPTGIGVAVFAGNVEGTVRTSAGLPLGISPLAAEGGKNQEHEVTTDLGCARNDCPLKAMRLRPSEKGVTRRVNAEDFLLYCTKGQNLDVYRLPTEPCEVLRPRLRVCGCYEIF